MDPEHIKALIEAGIPDAEAHVQGDGRYFLARVISDQFGGLPLVKQHQLVYAALGDNMDDAIHALSIQTYTRDAWAKVRDLQVI